VDAIRRARETERKVDAVIRLQWMILAVILAGVVFGYFAR